MRLKSLRLIAVALLSFCVTAASAQLTQLRTTDGKLHVYGQEKVFTTTDSTLTARNTLSVMDNTGGIAVVTVVGADSLGNAVTLKSTYRYHKAAGTLTLSSGTDQSALTTDTGLGTATATVSVVSNAIVVKCKGKLNYTVRWRVLVQQFYY